MPVPERISVLERISVEETRSLVVVSVAERQSADAKKLAAEDKEPPTRWRRR